MSKPSQTIGARPRAMVFQDVRPEIEGGLYPVKREAGDTLVVDATIFKEGHDKLTAVAIYRKVGSETWREIPMALVNPGLDHWQAELPLDEVGRYEYTLEAWADAYATWVDEIEKKQQAGQDVTLELLEGRELVAAAAGRAGGDDRTLLLDICAAFDARPAERLPLLLSTAVHAAMDRWPDRSHADRHHRVLEVVVERERARFAAWYEMFPRSQGNVPGKSATFEDCARRLPEVAGMGFDVVYLVPIHPIGQVNRKGANNTLEAGPDDPGSPYAIGSPEGGHTAVHPELGTLESFGRFRERAEELGMEIALDFAIQCAPDHPWVSEHPEWFRFRPDGSIRYAENPPKKYQDIVNVDFYCRDWEALWEALRDVVLFWVEQGVKIFRVDNPHTKPIAFWQWMIREVQERDPAVIFLSEAFTRPPMLKTLARSGFSQSYTYFTWRNFKHELIEYLNELAQSECREYLRPNFFANTPDILPPFLQTGGRPAFRIRLVLAATLSSLYGIYNGFELCENEAIEGTEEYRDSEKYQHKVWDWDRPGHIKDEIGRINAIRRENPALHEFENLRFHHAGDDRVLFYGKMTADRGNMIFTAVNLDPFEAHETDIAFPLHEMGIPPDEPFEIEELLTGQKHLWQGEVQHVRLDPHENPAAIFRVTPWEHVDFREPCL